MRSARRKGEKVRKERELVYMYERERKRESMRLRFKSLLNVELNSDSSMKPCE